MARNTFRVVPLVSLRVLLVLLVGLLVLVALGFAVRDLRQSLVSYRNAGLLAEHNRIADACLQAVQHFAFERGRSNVVLHSPEPISRESRDFIDGHRAAAQAHIADVLERLHQQVRDKSLPDGLAHSEAVRRAWVRVGTLRHALEGDFARRVAGRDPALAAQWLAVADGLVASLEALLVEMSSFPGELDAGFERLNTLRTLALRFRTLLGSESSVLAAQLSTGGVPGVAAIGKARLWRGGSTQVWSQLDAGVPRLADPKSSAALAALRHELFDGLRPLQDKIIAAAAPGRVPPVNGERYLAASVAALDASVALADAINEATAVHTRTRLLQARRDAQLAIAGIVAILLLGGLVVTVLVRRFTRPLNEVLGRIDRLLGAPSDVSRGGGRRFSGDEFGRMAQALECLEQELAARARSEAALNASERMSASILASVAQAIIATDMRGLITVFSPGAEAMLGYSAGEMIGRQKPRVLYDDDEVRARAATLSKELGRDVAADIHAIMAATVTLANPEVQEWTLVRKDGTRLTVLLAMSLLRNADGSVGGYLGVSTDVTERALAAAEINRMAHHDQLTRLPNRRLFHDRIQVAMNQARREKSCVALMLIDLDRFKPVNDRLGHPVGDLVLKAVAARMLGCLRESDTLARVGGDEFAVILPRVGEARDALLVAEKILHALAAPFDLAGGYRLSMSCSIGVAIYPEHGSDEKHLAKNADQAMYLAKRQGGNCARLFSNAAPGAENEEAEAGGAEPALRPLVWEASYQCGEASIDRQHRELLDRANALIQATQCAAPAPEQLTGLLDGFIACMVQHFDDEEALLSGHRFGGLAEHVLVHQALVDRARDLRQRAALGEVSADELVTYLAQDVVVGHLLEEDVMYFPWLKKTPGQRTAAAPGHEY